MRKYLSLILIIVTAGPLYSQATDNIGIGLTNPQSTLHIKDNGLQNNILNFYNIDNYPVLNFTAAGRLGINKPFPNAHLHVYTMMERPLISLIEPVKDQPNKIIFSNTAGRAWHISTFVPNTGGFPDGKIKIDYINTGNVLTVRGNNTVGIRNENPIYPLDITGGLSVTQALMPNGQAGNAGQVLKSLGTAQPPVWVNPIELESSSNLLSDVNNNGKVGAAGSGYNSSATIAIKSFIINSHAKVATNFGLTVQSYPSGTGYGMVRLELWEQSPSTLLQTHKHYFKTFGTDNSWYDSVNINKIFGIIHPTPGLNKTYEIRVFISHLDNSNIGYGGQPSGVFSARPFENFFNIKLFTE